MKYYVTDGYLSAYSGDFGIKNLLDLKNQVTVDPNQDRYHYNQMMWAARNFTFNMDNFKQYNYPIEYLRSIERVNFLQNNIVEYIATDKVGLQIGSGVTNQYGRNVIYPPAKMKGFRRINTALTNETYAQELKSEGFVEPSDMGYESYQVPILVSYSNTSASFCNDQSIWQSQFKIVNNLNLYTLIYEGYIYRPFYITGQFNISYMATSYTEKRLVYYGTSQPDDVEINGTGASRVNEVYDFTGRYLHDLAHNIRAYAQNGLISRECSHTHNGQGSFSVMPDMSLNPKHGNLTYRATDLYRHLESKKYGESSITTDDYLYQTSMSIGLTQALSQKWPQQLFTPTLSNCFYTIYTQNGSFYSHGLMPTVHDNDSGFDFICNPLFSTKIKLSDDRGVMHIGGFFPNNRQAIFTEDNISLPVSADSLYSDSLPAGAISGDNQFTAHFTGKIILASGGIYKGKRIPFKQEASKYIYVFDNSTMSFKVIGELPTSLFGCSIHTLSDNEFLVIGGIPTCPTARVDWGKIIPSKTVYKITLNNDLTLKSIDNAPNLKYGHFFAGITTVNDRLFIASGTNYELYDIKIGSLKSGQIKSPRYGCYIQKYITGEGYDQYALIGGWKHTSISGTNSICPIRYVGLSNTQRNDYNNALARSTTSSDYTDYNVHTSELEPESLAGYYMPDLDFITDNNFSLKYESHSIFDIAIYEDGTTSGSPNNISWNDKIEIVSGLEKIKDNIPSFTVDTKIVSNYGDKVTFTLPPASFYSPGDKVTVTYIDDFTSNYENQIYATYIDITQSDNYSTYSRNVVRKETYIYRLYKGDGSVIYEKQITVDTMHEQLSLTTSVKYPAVASEYVLTPTFSSSYDGDVYLVKDVHPEVKILLGKDKSGIGITMKTEVDSAPYLGWYLRIIRPNGVIREISNTYVSNIVIPTTFTVIAPSNYNSSDGILIGTEFTLQFDCPSGQLKNALFVNLNDSNAPKIPITIGTPFKYTPATSGYVTYHIECKTLDGTKTISSDSIVLNTIDTTTVEFEIISPANYTGNTLAIGTVLTLQLNCSNSAIKTGQITIMCSGKDNVYLDVNTNTPFTYTLQETIHLNGSVISAYGNSINTANQIEFNVAEAKATLEIISPAGSNGTYVDNGTVFTLRLNCTNPAIKTGRIGIQNPPNAEVYMDVNTNTPFTYTPPDYSILTLNGEVVNNGTIISTDYISLEVGFPVEIDLSLVSPANYNPSIDDILNGSEVTLKCATIIPNGLSLVQPLTITSWNGDSNGIIGGDKVVTSNVPFTLTLVDNSVTQLYVISKDDHGNDVQSNAIDITTVAVQQPKILLNIISPNNVSDGAWVLNGTEVTYKIIARIPDNRTLTDIVFNSNTEASGWTKPIAVDAPFTYTAADNADAQVWVTAKLSDGSSITSNTIYLYMKSNLYPDHS